MIEKSQYLDSPTLLKKCLPKPMPILVNLSSEHQRYFVVKGNTIIVNNPINRESIPIMLSNVPVCGNQYFDVTLRGYSGQRLGIGISRVANLRRSFAYMEDGSVTLILGQGVLAGNSFGKINGTVVSGDKIRVVVDLHRRKVQWRRISKN